GGPGLQVVHDLGAAVPRPVNDFVQLFPVDQLGDRDTRDGGVGDEGHHRVPVPAENHGLDILHRNTERVGQEAPVAGGVQHPGHPDHALPGEAGDFLGDPAHHVQRVGNHDDDGARRMPPDLLAYRFHDFDIGPYQVVAAHPRLPSDAGGDDKEIAASG